jgi:predicted Zn-dependent peptidase
VVSETGATFGISTAFGVGFRLEPKAAPASHLFEHMMFEGTPVCRRARSRA